MLNSIAVVDGRKKKKWNNGWCTAHEIYHTSDAETTTKREKGEMA